MSVSAHDACRSDAGPMHECWLSAPRVSDDPSTPRWIQQVSNDAPFDLIFRVPAKYPQPLQLKAFNVQLIALNGGIAIDVYRYRKV